MEKIATRGTRSGTPGNFSVLEKLVDQSYETATRGEVSAGKPNGSVFNVLFRIAEKK